jgi:hypothetical protein
MRCPSLEPARDALQCLDLFELGRIHVDDDGVAIGFLDFAAQLDDALFDRRELNQVGRRERSLGVLHERLVRGDEDDPLGLAGSGGHAFYSRDQLPLPIVCDCVAPAAPAAAPAVAPREAGTRRSVSWTPSCQGSTICMTEFPAIVLPALFVRPSARRYASFMHPEPRPARPMRIANFACARMNSFPRQIEDVA